jgi:WD40 repeat protein
MIDVYFSADGSMACSKNLDSSVSVWDLPSFNCLKKVKFECQPFSASLSPDKKYFVVNFNYEYTKENVRVVSVETGEVVAKASTKTKRPYSFFASDNDTVITLDDSVKSLKFRTNAASTMSFGDKATMIIGSTAEMISAIVTNSNDIYLFNLDNQERHLLIKHKDMESLVYCSGLAISPDNKYLYLCGYKTGEGDSTGAVVAYDLSTGQYLGKAIASASYLTSVFPSQDGTTLAVSDYFGNVSLLPSDLASGSSVLKTYSINKYTESLLLTPDNKKIIVGGYKTGVNILNTETDSVTVSDSVDISIQTSAINSNGSKIAIGTKEKYVGILEYDSQNDRYREVNYFKSDSSKSQYYLGISHVSFSSDDKYIIACASDCRTYIYNADTYAMVASFKGKDKISNTICSADMSDLNNYLFVADQTPAMRIFDVSSQEEVWKNDTLGKAFEPNSSEFSIKLSADNKYLAYAFRDGTFGVYGVSDYTSAEDNIITEKLSPIYPNPAGPVLFINADNLAWNGSIRIYSPEGVLLLQSPKSDRIDISSLAPGIYFISLGDTIYKFVKI